jgi:hypothetical protein
MSIALGPRGSGVLRMVHGKPGHLLHWCPGCAEAHVIDIHAVSRDGHVIGWDGAFEKPSIGEPVRHEKDGRVCEYVLRAGVLYFLANCTHALASRSAHLPEFPLPT